MHFSLLLAMAVVYRLRAPLAVTSLLGWTVTGNCELKLVLSLLSRYFVQGIPLLNKKPNDR